MKRMYQTIMAILVLITVTSPLFAQEPAAYAQDDNFNLYHTFKDSSARVFVNMAYIRTEPSSKSQLQDSLALGTPVTFLDDEGYHATFIRGMELPWHRIQYQADGKTRTGYIWLGLLSIDQQVDAKTGQLFMYGFAWKSNDPNDAYYWVEAKVLDKNLQLLNTKGFPFYHAEQSYSMSELQQGNSIATAKQTYSIRFLGEACGISSIHQALAFDGKQLILLPRTSSVSDAGVYYYDEELKFPKKHQLGKDIVLKTIETGEAEDYDMDNPPEELKYKISKVEETYQWDGQLYRKVAEKKIK